MVTSSICIFRITFKEIITMILIGHTYCRFILRFKLSTLLNYIVEVDNIVFEIKTI